MTAHPNERAAAMVPVAAALVDAVDRRDAPEIEQILTAPAVDWMALVVVLADEAGRGPSERYVAHVLADIASTQGRGRRRVAARYGLTRKALAQIKKDNEATPKPDRNDPPVPVDGYEIPREQPAPVELEDGAWVQQKGVQVWVAADREFTFTTKETA